MNQKTTAGEVLFKAFGFFLMCVLLFGIIVALFSEPKESSKLTPRQGQQLEYDSDYYNPNNEPSQFDQLPY